MTQTEKRIFLIKELLSEQPEYAGMEIPENEQEQKYLLRSLFNIRMPNPVREDFLKIQDAYLKKEAERKGITDFADLQPVQDNLYLWQGNMNFAKLLQDRLIKHKHMEIKNPCVF